MYWCQYAILIMAVVRYLMLVEETNMVEAIPIRHMFTIYLYLFRSTIPAFHSELTTYTISRLFTLGDNCELKGGAPRLHDKSKGFRSNHRFVETGLK